MLSSEPVFLRRRSTESHFDRVSCARRSLDGVQQEDWRVSGQRGGWLGRMVHFSSAGFGNPADVRMGPQYGDGALILLVLPHHREDALDIFAHLVEAYRTGRRLGAQFRDVEAEGSAKDAG